MRVLDLTSPRPFPRVPRPSTAGHIQRLLRTQPAVCCNLHCLWSVHRQLGRIGVSARRCALDRTACSVAVGVAEIQQLAVTEFDPPDARCVDEALLSLRQVRNRGSGARRPVERCLRAQPRRVRLRGARLGRRLTRAADRTPDPHSDESNAQHPTRPISAHHVANRIARRVVLQSPPTATPSAVEQPLKECQKNSSHNSLCVPSHRVHGSVHPRDRAILTPSMPHPRGTPREETPVQLGFPEWAIQDSNLWPLPCE